MTLSIIPIRIIYFVIKFSKRYDDLLIDIKSIKHIFDDYMDNIMIIITYCELILTNRQKKKRLKNLLKWSFLLEDKELFLASKP